MASAGQFDPYHKWLGIPLEEQPPHHYRLLGIRPFEVDPDVIQSAADQRMSHVRTFQAGRYSEASQRLLNEIAAAKVCLLKTARKAAYDAELKKQLDASNPAPLATPQRVIPVATAIPVTSVAEVFDPWDEEEPTARHRRRRRTKAPSRAPLWIFLGLAFLAAVLAGVGWFFYGADFQTEQRDRIGTKGHTEPGGQVPTPPSKIKGTGNDRKPRPAPSDTSTAVQGSSTPANPPPAPIVNKAPLAFRKMPVCIDDGDAHFSFQGDGWLREESAADAHKGTHHFHPATTETATAEWSFDRLEQGKSYDVFATWKANAGNTTEAHYRVTGVTDEPQEVMIDQREAPRGATRFNGHRFQKLGTFTSVAGTLKVQIASRSDGFVSADAVLINLAAQPGPPPSGSSPIDAPGE